MKESVWNKIIVGIISTFIGSIMVLYYQEKFMNHLKDTYLVQNIKVQEQLPKNPPKNNQPVARVAKLDNNDNKNFVSSTINNSEEQLNSEEVNYQPVVKEEKTSNYALIFDGIDDSVEVISSTYAMNELPLSLEAWVCPELRLDQIGGYTRYGSIYPNNVISNDKPTKSGHGFGLNVFSTGSELVVQFHSGKFHQVPSVQFIAGKWYHIAVVYTSGNVKVYINGILKDDCSYPQEDLDGSDYIRIGKHNNDSNWGTKRFFKGKLDEVTVWNIALNQAQVKNSMLNPPYPNETGLIGCWRFNEGIGSIAHDLCINSFYAQLFGAIWVESTHP